LPHLRPFRYGNKVGHRDASRFSGGCLIVS
jgi:hypothetical protein